MGIRDGGSMLIIGGTGPLGLLAIGYALHGERHPSHIVVTDHHDDKIERAKQLYADHGDIEITYINTEGAEDEAKLIRERSGLDGFDDIFVMSAHPDALSTASALAAEDACIDFFSGPRSLSFMASVNFYDMHYSRVHYNGISGGTADDMREAVLLVECKIATPANIVTHALGPDSVPYATQHQKEIGGAKIMVYTQKKCPCLPFPAWRKMIRSAGFFRRQTASGAKKQKTIFLRTRTILSE